MNITYTKTLVVNNIGSGIVIRMFGNKGEKLGVTIIRPIEEPAFIAMMAKIGYYEELKQGQTVYTRIEHED